MILLQEDVEAEVDFQGNRKSNTSRSRSLSPNSCRGHGLNVFDRLYGYVEKIKNHKEYLKKSIEENRVAQLLETSFR